MNRLTATGLVVLVVGVVLTGGGVYFSIAQEAGISDYRQTEGTVIAASVEPLEDGYYPNVTYRYEIEGVTYTSSNVFAPAGERRGSQREDAAEVVRGYRAGQSITVYYPEGEPGAASLRAPRDPGPVFAFGFGLVTIAGGFTIAVAGRQRERDLDLVLDDSPLPGVGGEKGASERENGSANAPDPEENDDASSDGDGDGGRVS